MHQRLNHTSSTPDLRIVRNANLYGCTRSIIAYRGFEEVGRAAFSPYPKPNWLIGPSGRPDADQLDVELAVDPELPNEEVLAKVELTLRLAVSKADAIPVNPFSAAPLIPLDEQIENVEHKLFPLIQKAETAEHWAAITKIEATELVPLLKLKMNERKRALYERAGRAAW